MKSPQESSRATLHVSTMMIVSFFLIETSRREIMLFFILGFHLDNPRQPQEIRADLQPDMPRHRDVDFRLNHGLVDAKTDDAPEPREPIGLPDGHHTRSPQPGQDILQVVQPGSADKQHMALFEVMVISESSIRQFPAVDDLP